MWELRLQPSTEKSDEGCCNYKDPGSWYSGWSSSISTIGGRPAALLWEPDGQVCSPALWVGKRQTGWQHSLLETGELPQDTSYLYPRYGVGNGDLDEDLPGIKFSFNCISPYVPSMWKWWRFVEKRLFSTWGFSDWTYLILRFMHYKYKFLKVIATHSPINSL